MPFGVKSNSLYRVILKKEKIFEPKVVDVIFLLETLSDGNT